jgi:hypothetical protein
VNVPIFYSLAVSYEAFRSPEEREIIFDKLSSLPINSLWIKISQSSTLTHNAVRNLVKGATEFHALGVPLIGDMVGGLRGLSALAFGAVGGIAHGVTQKENFNAQSWIRPANSNNRGFTWPTRVYIASLDMHLKKEEAEAFFEARGSKSRFGCREPNCCPKSFRDMLENPARHSLIQRSSEIQQLNNIPEQYRAERFLEETLRPATDAAVFSESLSLKDEFELGNRLTKRRVVLERLRVGLGEFVKDGQFGSFSQVPELRAKRH